MLRWIPECLSKLEVHEVIDHSGPLPKTYAELYERWRAYVEKELSEYPKSHASDEAGWLLWTHPRERGVPEEADLDWVVQIIKSEPKLITGEFGDDHKTVLGKLIGTICCAISHDLTSEFDDQVEKLIEFYGIGQDPDDTVPFSSIVSP